MRIEDDRGDDAGPRLTIRTAAPSDQQWVDESYEEIGFLSSDVTLDLVLIAEVDGVPAGLGRLVPAGEDACELGGMLVFDDFRGRGVARALIEELLRHAAGREVYCIPFADLEPIYAGAGFEKIAPHGSLPHHVRHKLEWCAREIDRPVVLMKLV